MLGVALGYGANDSSKSVTVIYDRVFHSFFQCLLRAKTVITKNKVGVRHANNQATGSRLLDTQDR